MPFCEPDMTCDLKFRCLCLPLPQLLMLWLLFSSGHAAVAQSQTLSEQDSATQESTATQESQPDSKAELSQTETDPIASPDADVLEKQDLVTQLKKEKEEFAKQTIEIPSTWKRLSKENHIWADKQNKQVIVRGAICMREGFLEMFACPRDTKEHEAIISVHASSYEVHATLVALGVDLRVYNFAH